jgi:hypothetical protein
MLNIKQRVDVGIQQKDKRNIFRLCNQCWSAALSMMMMMMMMMIFSFVGMLRIDVLYLYTTLFPFQILDVLNPIFSLMFGILLSYL